MYVHIGQLVSFAYWHYSICVFELQDTYMLLLIIAYAYLNYKIRSVFTLNQRKEAKKVTQLEVEIALERYRNEIESLKHRMDEVQRSVDAVHSLAQQMVVQTAEIKHLGQAVGEVKKDVAELKEKPGTRWESLISGLIGAAAGAIGAIFFR